MTDLATVIERIKREVRVDKAMVQWAWEKFHIKFTEEEVAARANPVIVKFVLEVISEEEGWERREMERDPGFFRKRRR